MVVWSLQLRDSVTWWELVDILCLSTSHLILLEGPGERTSPLLSTLTCLSDKLLLEDLRAPLVLYDGVCSPAPDPREDFWKPGHQDVTLLALTPAGCACFPLALTIAAHTQLIYLVLSCCPGQHSDFQMPWTHTVSSEPYQGHCLAFTVSCTIGSLLAFPAVETVG